MKWRKEKGSQNKGVFGLKMVESCEGRERMNEDGTRGGGSSWREVGSFGRRV